MVGTIANQDWWHAIEVQPGIVTPGWWDLRPTAEQIPWPDLAGKRCLDVGTADGFWAFEMERRGAAEVVASDIPSYFQSKARARFEIAHELLGSRVRYLESSVYDLEGEWDVVFMGYVLQVVTDPLGALEAVKRVCRGHVLVLDTISLPLCLLPSPLARLDARRDGGEWFVFNRRGLRKAFELSGWKVEAESGIIRDRSLRITSDDWKRRLGVRARSIAMRASI